MHSPKNDKMVKLIRFSTPFYLLLFICFFISAGFAPKTFKKIDRPEGVYIYGEHNLQLETEQRLDNYISTILEKYHPQASYRALTIVYPYNESIFPSEIAAPTLKWIEKKADIRNWLVMVSFDVRHKPLYILFDKPYWTPAK